MTNKQELAEIMGESNIKKPQIVKYPIVRLNGESGQFTKISVNDQGEYGTKEDLGKQVQGVIIAVRWGLSEYVPKKYSRWSNEYDSMSDKVTVWEKGKEQAFILDEGNHKDLRAKYQTLKPLRHLYMLFDGGELVRFDVKGPGLGKLFEYFGDFTNDEHVFEYVTAVSHEHYKSEAGRMLYKATFARGKKLSDEEMTVVASNLKKLHEGFRQLKEAFAKKSSNQVDQEHPKELPVVDYEESNINGEVEEEKENGNIQPENLPF